MPFKITFLKHILLPTTILLLVIVCVFGRLADTSIVDLSSGFSHPLEGWDHIVTMLAVGIWAAQLRNKAIWLLPLTFVGVMSLGSISGAEKYLAVPSAEVLILLSCLVFSILIIRKIRFDTKINVLIVAFFAFFHGYAHGQEISASASLISYTLGFVIATLLLHGAGILVAKLLLISITFFITQTLHITPIEKAKISPQIAHSVTFFDTQHVEISNEELQRNSPQWLSLSPPLKLILHFYKPPIQNWLAFDTLKMGIQHLKNGVGLTSPPCKLTYYVHASLPLIFIVSQIFCYVFYPKQHCDSILSLACCSCSTKLFHSIALPLTLSRLNHLLFSNFQISKRISMCIHLPKINASRLFLT